MGGSNARVYLTCFLAAAASTAASAEEAHWVTYEEAKVSTMVTSQERQRPSRQGISVRPSGFLPSVRTSPAGSFAAGISARLSEGSVDQIIELLVAGASAGALSA